MARSPQYTVLPGCDRKQGVTTRQPPLMWLQLKKFLARSAANGRLQFSVIYVHVTATAWSPNLLWPQHNRIRPLYPGFIISLSMQCIWALLTKSGAERLHKLKQLHQGLPSASVQICNMYGWQHYVLELPAAVCSKTCMTSHRANKYLCILHSLLFVLGPLWPVKGPFMHSLDHSYIL